MRCGTWFFDEGPLGREAKLSKKQRRDVRKPKEEHYAKCKNRRAGERRQA